MKPLKKIELNSIPCLYSLLYLDRKDKNHPQMAHHRYYAHGALESELGHDILRSEHTLPVGTYDVNIQHVDGRLIPAVFTSWSHDGGCYGLSHLGIAYTDNDGEEYAAKNLNRSSC